MESVPVDIDLTRLPTHLAVIMDGNGRWAKNKGARRIFGHRNAIQAVNEVTAGCAEVGIKYLTLYAFSAENWSRPKEEVEGLMELLVATIRKELNTLQENKIKLTTIGNTSTLPGSCQQELQEAIDATKFNDGLHLILALSYGGRGEIVEAVKKIALDYKSDKIALDDINPELFQQYLYTKDIPDPELLIRTSGEMRLSNFLLWQISYTEIYITETLWPDFRKEHLYDALRAYQKRERRFGKISEQVNS